MLARLRRCSLALCLLLLPAARTFAQAPTSITEAEAATRAHTAATALLTLYNHDTGLFNTTGWWNSANAITALADTSRLTPHEKDKSIRATLSNTFDRAPQGSSKPAPNFLNEFYDDEGWWALAWIDTFELTHDKRYLRMAETIFADMSGGCDTACGGGIWWKKDRHYKNAIANELFLDVAAKLALHTHRKQRAGYLDWANREWTWFAQTGMINSDGLINDGLDASCHNNGKTTWTYNQGVVLGGLVSLSKAAKSPALLDPANHIAAAAVTRLTDEQGILHDPCEPNCGEDGVQFKGIFTRDLAQLQKAIPNPTFGRFLATNAESVWSLARTPDNRFNTVWSSHAGPVNAGSQTSALDALNAALTVTP